MRRWYYSSFTRCRRVRHVHINNYMRRQQKQAKEIRRTQLFLCVCMRCVVTCDCDFCCTFAIVQINVNILIGEMTFHCEKWNLHIIVSVSALLNDNSKAIYLWSISFNFQSFSIPGALKYDTVCTQVAQGCWLKLGLCHWDFDHC